MSERTAEAIRKARSECQRKWRKRNPEKTKEYLNRYWEKRVMKEQAKEADGKQDHDE